MEAKLPTLLGAPRLAGGSHAELWPTCAGTETFEGAENCLKTPLTGPSLGERVDGTSIVSPLG